MPFSSPRNQIDRLGAIVLAGGQGTRLFPLTQFRCKPAVSFGGKYRLIDIPLSSALNSGISQIFVIGQHFAAILGQHIALTYGRKQNIHLISPEDHHDLTTWFQGTADAVRKNLKKLLQMPVDYFLILSGDHLYNIDFHDMFQFALNTNADLVIATKPVKKRDAERMGILNVDDQLKITLFHEKPKDPLILNKFSNLKHPKTPFLASMGIYIFKKETLLSLLKQEGNDFGKDLIPLAIQNKNSFAYLYNEYWVDIGTIPSFYAANMALLERKNCLNVHNPERPIYTRLENLASPYFNHSHISHSIVAQGSIIEADEIHHSIIGVRSFIKSGARIYNSILLGNQDGDLPFSVGKGSLLKNVILDENCHIGNHVELTNAKKIDHLDGDGFYIRDGITIISSGTKIPDHFTL